MAIAKSHGNKSKSERKAKRTPASKGMPTLTDKYNKADDLVEQVYVDIANGVTRSECIKKITSGIYDSMDRPLAARTAANYYNAALDRFSVDTDIEAERLRNVFWGRYEALYADCVKNNDRYNARCTLDSMAKIFLGLGREKAMIEIQQDANNIHISFGFNNQEEDDSNIQDAEIIETNED